MIRYLTIAGTLLLATLLTTASVNAGLVIGFEESAGDVIATTSGAIVVPASVNQTFTGDFLSGDTDNLVGASGSTSRFDGGITVLSLLDVDPSSFSGSTFGYFLEFIYFDAANTPGSTVSPSTTWTWDSTTLAGIGLGSLTASPSLVYTATNGETISFVRTSAPAVPEPSSLLLLGLGSAVALGRKGRKRQRSETELA